jgi:hypothetical protein
MKLFLVFCILFVGINADECKFEYDHLKVAHSDYLKNAGGWDFATYKDELKKLNDQFVEWKNSVDPKCFEGERGVKAKQIIDMFLNKFEFLNTIDENQKKTIYDPDHMKCFRDHGYQDIQTCVSGGDATKSVNFCE